MPMIVRRTSTPKLLPVGRTNSSFAVLRTTGFQISCSGGIELGSTNIESEIDAKNRAQLEKMSPEEIENAQAEIMKNMDRALKKILQKESLDNARKMFDEMSKKDFNSWAIMIVGYADNSEYEEVIRLFVNDKFWYIMYSFGSFPVSWIVVCVLKACGETMNVELGEQVHGWLLKFGYMGDLFVGSSLISFNGKFGCFKDGDMVFDQIG
ncbi:pentatricopeptide repeat-containing protein [Tanacetum coccineum]